MFRVSGRKLEHQPAKQMNTVRITWTLALILGRLMRNTSLGTKDNTTDSREALEGSLNTQPAGNV